MGVSHQPTKFPVQSLSTIDRSEDLYDFGLTHALESVTDMYIPSLHLYGTNISQPNKNDPRLLTSKRKKKEMTGVPRFEQSQNVERGYAAMPMCLPQASSLLNKMNDTVL